jgi:hypothetical protein
MSDGLVAVLERPIVILLLGPDPAAVVIVLLCEFILAVS